MPELNRPDTARPPRNVTLRDLSRNTSRLLDELRQTSRPLVVLRYGSPVAMITPLDPRGPLDSDHELERSSDLTDVQRRVLGALREGVPDSMMADRLAISAAEAAVTLTTLELSGLVERASVGCRVTRRGAAAVPG